MIRILNHLSKAKKLRQRTEIYRPPVILWRLMYLIWVEWLLGDLHSTDNQWKKERNQKYQWIFTCNNWSGPILFLSTLPVAGSTTSLSESWMYNRTRSPSRGITIQDPLLEWMSVFLRISGKSVSGIISTTPQMYSIKHISKEIRKDCKKDKCRRVCSPSISIFNAFRTHECAPTANSIQFKALHIARS